MNVMDIINLDKQTVKVTQYPSRYHVLDLCKYWF